MVKKLLTTIPLFQSVALTSDNFKNVGKKMTTKTMTKQGVRNIVGVSLISATADMIDNI